MHQILNVHIAAKSVRPPSRKITIKSLRTIFLHISLSFFPRHLRTPFLKDSNLQREGLEKSRVLFLQRDQIRCSKGASLK